MDFSPITNELFIGTTPSAADYDRLRGLGVRLVINMRLLHRPAPDPHPNSLAFLWLRTFDTPIILIPIDKLLHGAQTALETIKNGGKVYAHCAKGCHRSVVMGAAILIAQGQAPEAAMALIKQKRPVADPDMFYIRSRILFFAKQWQKIANRQASSP